MDPDDDEDVEAGGVLESMQDSSTDDSSPDITTTSHNMMGDSTSSDAVCTAAATTTAQHSQQQQQQADGDKQPRQQQQQQSMLGELPLAVTAAAMHPAAAEAAGPHFPGDPPGASLAPLATAAAARQQPIAGSSGSTDGSNAGSRRGVLSEAEAARILGSQANLWTEYVADEATAEYMLLPRLGALAEAVW